MMEMNKDIINLKNRIAMKQELAAEEQYWLSLQFQRGKLAQS